MANYDDTATVSGSVVSFSNGADDVPLKSCEVALSASLDGYSSVDVYKQGANVIDYASNLTTGTSGGLTFSVTADGGISYSGTASNTFAYVTAKFDFAIKSGQTFTFSRNTALSYIHRITLTFSDNSTENVSISANNTSVTYTPTKDVIAVRLLVAGLTADTYYNDTVYLQTQYGSTATAYEPYAAPTTHTVNLGRTIYGGTPDVVKGEGSTKVYKHTFTGDNLTSVSLNYGTTEDGYTHMYFYTGGIQSAYNPRSSNVISDIGVPWNNNASSSPHPSGECYRLLNTGSGESQRPTIYAYIHQTWESVEDFKTWLNANPITVVYEVADETNFTFKPVEISSRLGNNTMWSEQGNTELTYYKSGYGFTSVTVYKEQGKNLFGGWTKGYGVNSTTGEIFSRQDSAISDYIAVVPNTNYYVSGFSDEISSMVAYYDRNKVFISRSSGTQRLSLAITTPANCRYIILYQYRAGDQTASIDVIDNMQTQLEFGSEQTEYEPYVAPVSKTAYLHKVIYGGTADVVKGTCEPKNLLKNTLTNTTVNGTTFTVNNGVITISGTPSAQTRVYIKQGEAYTVDVASYFSSGAMPTGTRVFSKKVSGGTTTYPTLSPTSSMATVGDVFSDILLEINTTYDGTEFSIYPQIEHGSSASDYTPYFEPFTFPPVSMETDEGENNLFANEGDSAITYRKAVD